MGSETHLRIPVVDLSGGDLKPGSHDWEVARAQVRAALELYGCFEALHDGVTPELREAFYGTVKQLFALPLEAKLRNVSHKIFHAYVGQIPSLPDYESLAIDDVLNPAAASGFTHLMWPQGNPAFCEAIRNFAKKAAQVDGMVRRMVLESLGVDQHYQSHMESTNYMLRLSENKPPGGPGEEAARDSLPCHIDGEMCTLVYQLNHVDGLEVQAARSGDWITVTPTPPGAFVFITGDAFRAWSNGRLYPPTHRVRVGGGETRYSVMLFAVPREDTLVEAPGELVEEGRPPRFKPYLHQDYVKFSLSARNAAEVGDLTSILTDFCGTEAERPLQPSSSAESQNLSCSRGHDTCINACTGAAGPA